MRLFDVRAGGRPSPQLGIEPAVENDWPSVVVTYRPEMWSGMKLPEPPAIVLTVTIQDFVTSPAVTWSATLSVTFGPPDGTSQVTWKLMVNT